MAEQTYSLPSLAYNLNDLEPAISAQIMTLHYTKHHQTYITNLNNALKQQAQATSSQNLVKHLELQQAIKFNAGGHINHTLFWENLQPPQPNNSSDQAVRQAAPTLSDAIARRWGSLDAFRGKFEATALALQGSGWVWLVKDAQPDATAGGQGNNSSGSFNLSIVTSKDQDIVQPTTDKIPVLGVDMWEHAYYLQYLNNKKGYLEKMWDVINWATVERRFVAKEAGLVFGEALAGLAAKM